MYISLRDSIQLASKLSLKRITNAFQVYRSFHHSKRQGESAMCGMPVSLSIEPTTACNLRCPECPSGLRNFTRPTGMLSQALFEKTINELAPTLLYLIFYFQGEPYLNPHLTDMIQYAASKNLYTATSTNAHFLSDKLAEDTVRSGLNRLIISIDGASQTTYESYRKNGSLDEVLKGTATLMKWKKQLKSSTPHVVWQFLVVRPNEHEIPEIKRLAKSYGVDSLAFKSAQIYDFENGNELIPRQDQYSRYKQLPNGKYVPKAIAEDECWKMWHSCVMTWDGKVVPCCFDKDAHHVLGELGEVNFADIWKSKAYDDFRNQLFNSRDQIEMCKNCSEGAKVWV